MNDLVQFRFKDGASPTLDDFAAQYPKQFAKGLRDLGSWLRKQVAEQLRSAQAAGQSLPPLDTLTVRLKEATAIQDFRKRKIGKKSKRKTNPTRQIQRLSRAFGGRLPDIVEYLVTDGTVDVGYLGKTFPGSGKVAARFQSAETRPFTRYEHRMIRLLLGAHFKQPSQLTRPARPVITDWANSPQLRAKAGEVIVKSIQAQLNASIQKAIKP